MVTRRRVLIFSVVAFIAFIAMAGRTDAPLSLSFGVQEMGLSAERAPFALITVTNDGGRPAKWGYDGCWLEVQTRDGCVTNNLSGGGILEPGAHSSFSLRLPPETRTWRVRCVVSQASTRQRVSFWLRQGWDGKIRQMGRRFLPNKEGPRQTVCSHVFVYENFVEDLSDAASAEVDLMKVTDIGL